MRLLQRHDAPLAAGLIAGTVVIFQRPLRFVLDIASEIEHRYNLDLIPALVVLSVVFVFHQYRKRQEVNAEARAAEAQARVEALRARELEQLVGLGRGLANALDFPSLQQALWRHLPEFLRDCPIWLVVQDRSDWRVVVEDTSLVDRPSHELLASLGSRAARRAIEAGDGSAGILIDGYRCFPVRAGEQQVGMLIVHENMAMLGDDERRALAPMLTFLGIAIRNVQLLSDTRETSIRDGLTQWFNRRHGEDTLRVELQRAKRTGAPLSVVMFDLDHFKQLNDQCGHQQGDAALVAVARQVERMLRSTDVKCRFGGDEFLVILPETPIGGAQQVADHMVRAIASMPAEGSVALTASIGVAAARPGELDVEALIARADGALYRAKREGRNRVWQDEDTAPRPFAAGRRVVALHQ